MSMDGTSEKSREPWPDQILGDIGVAFAMGAVGGTAYHFMEGMYNSPNGARFIGGSQAVRMNVPRLGGRFAVWGGLFSSFDCTLVYLREKEDPWNSIMAGAAASGSFRMRQGLGRVAKSALLVGTFLAFIEGGSIIMDKLVSASQIIDPSSLEQQASRPISMEQFQTTSPDPSSSWFRGLFGGGGGKKTSGGGGSKTEILESFD